LAEAVVMLQTQSETGILHQYLIFTTCHSFFSHYK
jgi:hypothetical protein